MSFFTAILFGVLCFILYKFIKFYKFKQRIINQIKEEGFSLSEARQLYDIEHNQIANMHHSGFSDFYIAVSIRKTYKPEIIDADWREEKYMDEANKIFLK